MKNEERRVESRLCTVGKGRLKGERRVERVNGGGEKKDEGCRGEERRTWSGDGPTRDGARDGTGVAAAGGRGGGEWLVSLTRLGRGVKNNRG